jgi:hypothetical protein
MTRKTLLLLLGIILGVVGILSESYSLAEPTEGVHQMIVPQVVDVTFWYVFGDEDQTLRITSLSKHPSDEAILVEVLSLPLIQRAGGPKYRQGRLPVPQQQQLMGDLLDSTHEPLQEVYQFPGTTAEHPAWLQGEYTTAGGIVGRFKTLLDVYSERGTASVEVAKAGQVLRLVKTIRNCETAAVVADTDDFANQKIRSELSENYDSCPAELRPFLAKGLVLVGKFSESLLQDTDPSVRIYTLWGLVETSPQEARKYLQRALEDPDPSVREFAQEQLSLSY